MSLLHASAPNLLTVNALSQAPDLSQGPAIVLWDNLWGTNYVMWAPFNGGSEDDFQFRFDMRMW